MKLTLVRELSGVYVADAVGSRPWTPLSNSKWLYPNKFIHEATTYNKFSEEASFILQICI